jgi:hypothetical protein
MLAGCATFQGGAFSVLPIYCTKQHLQRAGVALLFALFLTAGFEQSGTRGILEALNLNYGS